MTWILIVILYSQPPTPITIERFPNKASCAAAMQWISQAYDGYRVQMTCIEDSKK